MCSRSPILLTILFFLYFSGLQGQNSLSFIQKAYEEKNLPLAQKSIDHYFLEHSGEVGQNAWFLKGEIYAMKGMSELESRNTTAQESFRIARYSYLRGDEARKKSRDESMGNSQARILEMYKQILSEANGFYLQNELGWCIRAAQWAMAVKPDEEKAYEMAIETALEIRDFPKAMKCIENALHQFSEGEKYLKLKRDCLSRMVNSEVTHGAWNEVRDHLIQLVELDPLNGDYHFNLGMAYHKLGDNAHAIEQLVKTTRLNPDDYISYYYLAKIQYDKALAIEEAAQQKALLQKASLYLQIGHQIHPRQPAINDLMAEVNRLLR